jgi:hypothetical protein
MTKSMLKNLITLGEGVTTEFKRSGTSNLSRELINSSYPPPQPSRCENINNLSRME